MKYLVISHQKHPMPPEMVPSLFAALRAYTARMRAAGKMEQSWSFAGLMGGGAILNVDSLEELDEVLTQFPLGPFASTEIYGLVDVDRAAETIQKAATAMLEAMAKH